MKKFVTHSADETENFALNFAKTLSGGMVVELIGDLGAGKTVFAKGFAKGLGIGQPITSPTFALLNTYEGKFLLNHFDLYRIEDMDELYVLGFEDIFNDSLAISLIEWPQIAESLLPKERFRITINKLSDNDREIIVEKI